MRAPPRGEDDPPLVSAKLASPSALRPPHVSLCFLIRIFAAEPQALKKRGLLFEVTPCYLGRFAVFLLDQIKGEDDIRYPPLSLLLTNLKKSLGEEGDQIGDVLVSELQVRSSQQTSFKVFQMAVQPFTLRCSWGWCLSEKWIWLTPDSVI